MKQNLVNLVWEIEIGPDERLSFPQELIDIVSTGRWLVSISPADRGQPAPTRDHSAFLQSYSPEDDALYENYPGR